MKGIKVVNKGERGEIYITGTIVDDFTGDMLKGFDINEGYAFPAKIRDALKELEGKPIDVYIDSNGGLVSAGMSIAAMLSRHKEPTVAHIDTWAASIASVIALACDRVEMPVGTYIMIHRPLCEVVGNEDDFKEAIAFLQKMGNGILDIYESKKNENVTRDEIWQKMCEETWLNPKEAAALFANVHETEAKFAVAAEAVSYDNAPDAVKNMVFGKALKAIEESRGIGDEEECGIS